jgi:hypothetical protein
MIETKEAEAQPLERLTGWRGSPEYFRFLEPERFDPGLVVDVLRGKVAGVMFREAIDPAAASELVRRFWESPARKPRGGKVCESQGWYVGAYHFHKPTRQYLEESEAVAGYMDSLLDVPNEPSRWFRRELTARLAQEGVSFRLSEKDGLKACPALLRCWTLQGEYALQPHEDESQLRHPAQADFEIQRSLDYHVCAVNMCLENGDKGRLAFWNVIADEESKNRLGIHAGNPYPPEVLEGIESIWIDVRPGDVYVFNGSHVHAVEAGTGSKRTTVAWNMGFIDERTVVSWT